MDAFWWRDGWGGAGGLRSVRARGGSLNNGFFFFRFFLRARDRPGPRELYTDLGLVLCPISLARDSRISGSIYDRSGDRESRNRYRSGFRGSPVSIETP